MLVYVQAFWEDLKDKLCRFMDSAQSEKYHTNVGLWGASQPNIFLYISMFYHTQLISVL